MLIIISQGSLCSLFVQLWKVLLVNCFTIQQEGSVNINRINVPGGAELCCTEHIFIAKLRLVKKIEQLTTPSSLSMSTSSRPSLDSVSSLSLCSEPSEFCLLLRLLSDIFTVRKRNLSQVETFSAHGHARSIHRTLLQQAGLAELKPVSALLAGTATLNYSSPGGQIVFTVQCGHGSVSFLYLSVFLLFSLLIFFIEKLMQKY